jgi:hypothetical protein
MLGSASMISVISRAGKDGLANGCKMRNVETAVDRSDRPSNVSGLAKK